MNTGEIISLIGLIASATVCVTGTIVFFKNAGKDAAERGGKNAEILSKIDFIKVQTELISAKSNAISEKLDDQNARLIVVEQKAESAGLPDLPAKIARIEESLKSAHRRIGELAEDIKTQREEEK